MSAEVNYTAVEQDSEDEDMGEMECEVLITVQHIQKTALLNDLLTITLLAQDIEHECDLEIEECDDPEPGMQIKARLQFTKKCLFDFIQ